MVQKIIVANGRRKTSVAKVKIKEGSGKVLYNFLPYEKLERFQRLGLGEPIKISEGVLGDFNFDVEIKTTGGGKESQIEAARLGVAKALVNITKSDVLKKAFLEYDRNLLVGDTRRKETRKPGDSKARAKRQSSKR